VAPVPAAAAAASSHSLRNALRKGLVVRYSVSERVAGHFEVLLAASLAHRLGVHGALAVGLPSGTPAQVVIGKAILVTSAAGKSTARVQFTKNAASRLARVHSVTVLLRLIVRNSALQTSTVLSTVSLSH
jgi:hypothetical protein